MAISKLILGGVKSLRERTEIPIAPLTLLFGPNSSGKSAVLHAAPKLREKLEEETQIVGHTDRRVRNQLGGYASQVHRLPHNENLADPLTVALTLGR